MNLNDRDWAEFQVGDIFKLQRGHTLTVEQKEEYEGNISCINGTIENNGVQCKLSRNIETIGFNIIKAPAISIVRVGNGGKTFVQTEDFYIADNAFALTPLISMSIFSMMFISTILDSEQLKYSYGRTVTNDYSNTIIKLPVDSDDNPDWQFMEDYIKSLHHKQLTTKNKSGQAPTLNVQDWKEFLLYDYFDIIAGKYHYPDEYEEGSTPYYSASNENNGIGSYIDLQPDFDGNRIVTGKVGCTAFYAPEPFCATSDVNIFIPKFNMTSYVGLFVANVINFNENYKWAYGRQCRVGNSQKIQIKLPADSNGNPDWQFMENYIKALPYGDRLEG